MEGKKGMHGRKIGLCRFYRVPSVHALRHFIHKTARLDCAFINLIHLKHSCTCASDFLILNESRYIPDESFAYRDKSSAPQINGCDNKSSRKKGAVS